MNSRKNVLFLASWYPSTTNPTLGNFIQKHAEAASKHHNITTLSLHPRSGGALVIEKNQVGALTELRVYYPKAKGVFRRLRQFVQWNRAFAFGVSTFRRMKGDPDLVHLNVVFPMGFWLKRYFPTTPYVITEHASGLHEGPNAYPNWILRRMIPVYQNAQGILPVSANLGERIKRLAGISYTVLPNVVNEGLFVLSEEAKGSKRLVHVSTLYEAAKNVHGMLRAVHRLSEKTPDFEFHIITDGDATKAKALANELGLLNRFVFFHGTMETQEIAAFLCRCKGLVLFSNFENFPCVIPEAWMSGIPVIATAVNGIPEFANDENSILIEPRNEEQLTLAMLERLNGKPFDPQKLRAYALKHFSYAAVAKQLDEVYRQVAST
jgi:glycosyltransferase involved in cell wall biosynthesis